MTLRTRFAVAFALVAGLAIGGAVVLSYDAIAGLLKVSTTATFHALVDSVATRSRLVSLAPQSFRAPQDRSSVEYQVVASRQVIAQVLAGDGHIAVRERGNPLLPVTTGDRGLAAEAAAGSRAERTFRIGDDTYDLVTVSLGGGRGAVQLAQPADERDRLLGRLASYLALIGLGAFAIAGAAGWLVAGRITRRLERLTGAAEQVAASGRLDIAVPVDGRDEVGRLAAAFDSMLGQLAESRAAQQQLVQDAEHELRTPLTSIRTNVTVLRQLDDLPPDARQRLVDDLDGETRELIDLVNELVELATEQRAEQPRVRTELGALAERSAAQIRRRTSRPVGVDADGSHASVRPAAVQRAMLNLLDNAVKFTAGEVEIRVRAGRISVLDRGPGIAESDRGLVFRRFYRADAARALPGSGLGLAIVREVAMAHGGSVFADNRPGGGSAIGFTVPVLPCSCRALTLRR